MTRARCIGGLGTRIPALAVLCLAAFLGGSASAMDFNDVVTLVSNKVDENVIINMANSDKNLYITYEQANQLYGMGASERLVNSLRPRSTGGGPAMTPVPVVEPAPAARVSSAPAVVSSTVVSRTSVPADGSPIVAAPIIRSSAMPALYSKEGFLSVFNRDWVPYYLNIDLKRHRMFLSRNPNGGALIQSGENLILNIRKEGYKLYGDSGNDLEVKVREGETTTLSLEPFGVFGNSGLTGVAVSRDKVKSEVLINNYVPPPAVVIAPAPAVVVAPAPPPVIVVPPPPPIYYSRPPYYRYGGGGWGGAFYYSR